MPREGVTTLTEVARMMQLLFATWQTCRSAGTL